jgi:dolichol-phosphate mannosyltransferase
MNLPGIDAQYRARWEVPEFDIVFSAPRLHEHCVVIPVINEGTRIHSLLRRMASAGIDRIGEIIIVDGGSTDGSLEEHELRRTGVSCLLVKKGEGGLSAQLRCAYAHALDQGYAGIVTIDGNDKDDPRAIPAFVSALREGVDFVQASRFIAGGVGENTPLAREWAIRLVHAPLLSRFSHFHWTDTTQGFRGYSRRLLLDPRIAPFRRVFSRYELLAYLSYRAPRLGYRCLEVPTTRSYPRGEAVPTKIAGVRAILDLLATVLRACAGGYDPAKNG